MLLWIKRCKNLQKPAKTATILCYLNAFLDLAAMAKQAGKYLITGTIDDLTFYKMYGQYYVRMKSSLTRKRVLKSPAFARTRQSANELASASVIASGVYRTIARDKRMVEWYRKMTGMAKLLFRNGESREKILDVLKEYIAEVLKTEKTVEKTVATKRRLFTTFKPARVRKKLWKNSLLDRDENTTTTFLPRSESMHCREPDLMTVTNVCKKDNLI